MRLAFALIAAMAVAGCDLEERADYLIGRVCDPIASSSCEGEQVCLPHRFEGNAPADFRCRDAASFDPVEGKEPPLAYCDEEDDLRCPGDLVCRADRLRASDGGYRRRVCQKPEDPFGPPV